MGYNAPFSVRLLSYGLMDCFLSGAAFMAAAMLYGASRGIARGLVPDALAPVMHLFGPWCAFAAAAAGVVFALRAIARAQYTEY